MALDLSGISSISTSFMSQVKTITPYGTKITNLLNLNSSPSTFINESSQLLSSFGSVYQSDNVILYDENSNQILTTCAIFSAKVDNSAQLAEHPLEDGSRMVDHKIFLPKELSIIIYLSSNGYKDEYNTIKSLYEGRKFITAQLKNDVYSNLQIVGLPHEETTSSVDRLIVQINLKEAIMVTSKVVGFISPSLKSHSSTVSTTPAYKKGDTVAKQIVNNTSEAATNLKTNLKNALSSAKNAISDLLN